MTDHAILRILECRVTERPVRMRLPFRFGDVTVRETAEAYVSIVAECNGVRVEGMAAQLMVPRWFDKRPSLSNEQTVEELRQSLITAAGSAVGREGMVAELSRDLRAVVISAMPADTPRLAAQFGPAAIEMAMIDAACRAMGLPFHDAARLDLFGLSRFGGELSATDLREALSAIRPRWRVGIRHTVGYDSPLTTAEVGDRPDNDAVALDEVIAATGIKAFKIKLKGDAVADIDRLRRVAAVIDGGPTYQATLDANEQYDPGEFTAFLAALKGDADLARLREATLFVEQPFGRDVALSRKVSLAPGSPPVVIDESDSDDGSFVEGWKLGWSGTSIKSCKGVLRALLNHARVVRLRAEGKNAILTGEDLTCQPGLCWQQDTLMASAVGIIQAERNGHFHAGGMQGASDDEIAAATIAHPDIYELANGRPRLKIRGGQVAFGSLDRAGFGHSYPVDTSRDKELASF
jgi:hypothetical protein